jgi:hypothetical protein
LPIYTFSALAAPSFILNAIRTLQRNFLWQGIKTGKKLALISWENICRPKAQGGLGIKYPSTMNKVLSAKSWWRWLKRPQDLWAKLWRRKYTPNTVERNLIRWNGDTPGSLIWMESRQNRILVVNHAFWEIRNGQTTFFWNDSWQQLPILAQDSRADTFLTPATQVGMTKVADYWQENSMDATWRCWKSTREDLHIEAARGLTTMVQPDQRQENSYSSRRGHLVMGTFFTGYFQYPRSLCHQGEF